MAYYGIPPGWLFSDVYGWHPNEHPWHFRHGYDRNLLPDPEAMTTEPIPPVVVDAEEPTPQPAAAPAGEVEITISLSLARALCDVHVMSSMERRDLAKGMREALEDYDRQVALKELAIKTLGETDGGLTEHDE